MKTPRIPTELFRRLAVRRGAWARALVSVCLASGGVLFFPWWTKTLVEKVLPARSLSLFAGHLALGLLALAWTAFFTFAREYQLSRIALSTVMDFRRDLYAKILGLPVQEIARAGTGDLLSRASNDTSALETSLTASAVVLAPNAVTLAFLSVAMLVYAPWLTLFAALLLAPMGYATAFSGRKILSHARESQNMQGRLMTLTEESLLGIREIRSHGQGERFCGRYGDIARKTLRAQYRQALAVAAHPQVVAVVNGLGVFLMALACGWLVFSGRLSQENLVAFFTCVVLLGAPLGQVTGAVRHAARLLAVLERLFQVLDGAGEETDARLPDLSVRRGALEFSGVRFSYGVPGRGPALDDIGLALAPGETVALVGPSGSGKSTLLDLAAGFLEPDRGRILVDGRDTDRFSKRSLRKAVGIVFQEPVIFSGTLYENILMGDPRASREAVLDAARAARVDEFAERLPLGYDTAVGVRGHGLSVGQRQRVAIARVLLKDPRILLMDEPTSALDPESERLVLQALEGLRRGRTTLVAAHRPALARDADRIVVLSQGKILEQGTHTALMDRQALYHAMVSGTGEAKP